jgi:predicted DsbA family dithiol-disulfide isomerase
MSPTLAPTKTIQIDIWSDVMCPFCYMGDTLLDQALARFDHSDEVGITYHSFLLMPDLPVDQPMSTAEMFDKYKGFPPEQTAQMHAQLTARGKELGLDYQFDKSIAVNMLAAHELSHFAKAHGRQHEMIQRLFRAHFTEGLNVGDLQVLADLAAEIGLDRDDALAALTSHEYAADVDADLRQARELGIQGVPFFVFNMKYAVSGAQPVEAFAQVLDKVWEEL